MSHEDAQASKKDANSVKTILLVEDDVSIGEVLVQAISQETSYLALLVSDGFEALNMVNGIKPNLFILDFHLPRMNGIELYDRLHAMPALTQVPVIMISARLPEKELARRSIIGMNKPLDLDEFLEAIEDLLA
jgi:DNA-binding response OmpR family regulator